MHSTKALNSPGLADVVNGVINNFKLKQPAFIGFDAGAGCGMKMACKDQKKFRAVIGESLNFLEENDDIKRLNTKFLALNDKDDSEHNFGKTKSIVAKINNGKGGKIIGISGKDYSSSKSL